MTPLFQKKLQKLKERGQYRSLSLQHGIDLTSNDYLGLAEDDFLRRYAIEYLQKGGDIGAGGSRLLRGHTEAHAALEDYAAQFFAAPKALYLSSGFQANTTLFQTLCGRHDTIIYDEFVHASAREGIQNAHAKHIKVQHNDIDAFETACQNAYKKSSGKIWVAVESIYSMDGDIAPLDDLFALAQHYDAMLVIDEAHGTGVMGDGGRGLAYDFYSLSSQEIASSQAPRNDGFFDNVITLHTCGKAIGVAGGLICASEDVINMMINTARGFIYSTAPMPLQAYLVQKSLEFIGGDEGQKRRDLLQKLSRKAQQLFDTPNGAKGTHIVPLMIGDNDEAVLIAQKLQQKGWDIRAIRPPTVPQGTARLRLSLSANLNEDILTKFAEDYKQDYVKFLIDES